ncbi:phosphoribosylamine--glycine ligase [soil metagenome]|nr:phosphoribosylamine--glycine ligase [Acidobacteriota bacterium]
MQVLVVGSGGREHALAWKLAGESGVSRVFCAPGNPGTAPLADTIPIEASDIEGLAAFAKARHVDLTVVGPELPLDRGIVDLFQARGLRIFGPSRAAAQLECSKVFAKAFMERHRIPTARYRICEAAAAAHAVIASGELGFPLVVKADGLAGGKGVVIAPDKAAADAAIHAAMDARQFGDAGSRVVIEECLAGPEVSFFAVCDGRRAAALMSAQDHKRIFDDDQGPNTGGMGAFSPSPLMDEAMEAHVMRDIIDPVVAGLRAEGREYRGFLYAGLMLTVDGPKVIEFNVRFGDPEAQVIIPMLAEDLAPRLAAAADGVLDASPVVFKPERHVGVVMAAAGYPDAVVGGMPIRGLAEASASEYVLVFHAGTASGPDGAIVTAGGRVLTIVGRGRTFEAAIERAYDGVSRVTFEGMQYRKDIGRKARHV